MRVAFFGRTANRIRHGLTDLRRNYSIRPSRAGQSLRDYEALRLIARISLSGQAKERQGRLAGRGRDQHETGSRRPRNRLDR